MPSLPTREERELAVRQAVHSSEMEGLSVTPECRAILDEYVEGRIDSAEMVRRTLALHGVG